MILSWLLPKIVCHQTVDTIRQNDSESAILMSYAYFVRSDPSVLLSNTTSQDEFEATLLPLLEPVYFFPIPLVFGQNR